MYSVFGYSLEVLSALGKKHAAILNNVCGGERRQTRLSSKLFPFVT